MAAEKLRFFHLQVWEIEKFVESVKHIYIYTTYIQGKNDAKMSQHVVLVMPYRLSFIGVVIKWEPFFGIGVGVGSGWVLGKDCMVFHVSHVELGVPKLVKWHLFSLLTNKKGEFFSHNFSYSLQKLPKSSYLRFSPRTKPWLCMS